jgi:hypothetical protein
MSALPPQADMLIVGIVWNRTATKMLPLVGVGTHGASSPAAAAQGQSPNPDLRGKLSRDEADHG